MPRTYVIICADTALGRATEALLESRGERVIGIGSEDVAANPAGRQALVERAASHGEGTIDAVVAIEPDARSAPGLIDLIDALRPLLGESVAPRAVVATPSGELAASTQRVAVGPAWAGAGIPLNAVSPGAAHPELAAGLVAWLVSVENAQLCGHTIFVGDAA